MEQKLARISFILIGVLVITISLFEFQYSLDCEKSSNKRLNEQESSTQITDEKKHDKSTKKGGRDLESEGIKFPSIFNAFT